MYVLAEKSHKRQEMLKSVSVASIHATLAGSCHASVVFCGRVISNIALFSHPRREITF